MKKNKIETITSLMIFSVLLIMMIISIFFTIVPKILVKLNLTTEKVNNFFQISEPISRIDFSKKYPFEKNTINEENSKKTNVVAKYLSLNTSIKDQI